MLAPSESETVASFPIVAVGASAGGLDAFSQLLRHVPADTGFGFVLIQHLDRTHTSGLSEALSKVTAMPVRQAEHGARVEPNRVYVIPPNADLALRAGCLVLSMRSTGESKPHLPVDFFMHSLASELGGRAIGVVLSGSASDGTEGLRAIQERDGITFAQLPSSAKFPGMPQSAVEAGVVDYGLSIPELASELARLSTHPYMQSIALEAREPDADIREAIFARVRADFGVDFGEFKQTTVTRRLARRLALRRVGDLTSYLALLKSEPNEVRALYEDMLIHVTAFFRDPEVFEVLRTAVFPEIIRHKPAGMPVRVWVAGCSTGEEVYSLAMAWLDSFGDVSTAPVINFFGSDVSEVSVQKARIGVYSDAAMRDVSDERRIRYFSKVDGGYRIKKAVRELCLFARHDLVRGPPFSKLDIVSCRNVLIYFDQALHKEVLPTLHYALNQPGFLVLGRSENIGSFGHLFTPLDKANKIFVRADVASALRVSTRTELRLPVGAPRGRSHTPPFERTSMYEKHLDRLLLARYCPPGVLVNANLDVLLFRGQTGAYLQAAPGQPQTSLIGMAREGLLAALRATMEQAKQERTIVRRKGVEVGRDGTTTVCDLVVVPFSGLPESQESLFIVLFEDAEAGQGFAPKRALELEPDAPAQSRRIARLEHELAATKEYLHTLIDEHSRASDELGASNEELLSGNEELQSMNEELETAKEELQSINEELTTLNDELRTRNQEAAQANSDLANFAAIVDIPILTLDKQMRVRRFTPQARTILNVLPADVGRSIDDIKLNINVPNLSEQIAVVIRDAATTEAEVQDARGRWYRMQIRPYTNADDLVDGAIISLVDVNALKTLIAEGADARGQAERANAAKDDFLATLSHELRTPLSSMLLTAQQLRGGTAMTQEQLQRTGERLERSTLLQVDLIDDLLDVSRIVAGKLTLTRHLVDLGSVVEAAIDEVAVLAAAKDLVLNVALDAKVGALWLDRTRSQQIVSNLLTNAIKFTPKGGQITVVVQTEGGVVHLRVTDTGIGIEPSFLPHVFARFSQRDSTITRRHGGLGLGLALVRHLVEAQGGSVRAESAGVGQGATFTVSFPLPVDPERGASAPEVGGVLGRPGRAHHYEALEGLRILVVDDDLRTREAVLEVLHLAGAQVALAASAAEGRSSITSFRPQIILCDIAMPEEDGYSFIRQLRAAPIEQGAAIPALALTAMATEEDRRRALAAGFQMHLAKPIDIDRLREAVRTLSAMSASPAVQHDVIA
jgi:two-component system CheB/CheR fusion protein